MLLIIIIAEIIKIWDENLNKIEKVYNIFDNKI